jgi:hypothetical protein
VRLSAKRQVDGYAGCGNRNIGTVPNCVGAVRCMLRVTRLESITASTPAAAATAAFVIMPLSWFAWLRRNRTGFRRR